MAVRKFLWFVDKKTKQKQYIEIKRDKNYEEVVVYAGLHKLGVVKSKEKILEGVDFQTKNGKKITIRLVKILNFLYDWEILVDDKILPGSPMDPNFQIDQIFWLVVLIGIVNVFLGLVGSLKPGIFLDMQIGLGSIIYGILLIVLALGFRKKIIFFLWLILGLWLLDLGYWLYLSFYSGTYSVASIAIKFMILLFLFKGLRGLKTNKYFFKKG